MVRREDDGDAGSTTGPDDGRFVIRARIYDGRSAIPLDVEVRIVGPRVVLTPFGACDEGRSEVVARTMLRVTSRDPGGWWLGREDEPDWRLRLPEQPLTSDMRDLLTTARRPLPKHPWRVVSGLAVIVSIMGALLLVVLRPEAVVRFLPRAVDRLLGESAERALARRWEFCEGAQAALAPLMARLLADRPEHARPRVRVVKGDVVNAIALPGGRIILFTGLLKALDSPEGLAGVLAHEVAHDDGRHGMIGWIRGQGIGLLLSEFVRIGGADPLGMLIHFSFSRRMETQADLKALEILRRARMSPEGLADFLAVIAARTDEQEAGAADRDEQAAADPRGEEDAAGSLMDGWSAYLSTHPAPEIRLRRIRAYLAEHPARVAFVPPLSEEALADLRSLCEERDGAS